MNTNLLKIRVTSFAYEAGSLIAVALLGVLVSSDFQQLITAHFGDTFLTSAALLVITGVVKHLRNLQTLKKFGAASVENRGYLI